MSRHAEYSDPAESSLQGVLRVGFLYVLFGA